MRLKELLEGVTIIAKYAKENESHIEGQHDQIFLPRTGNAISTEEITQLRKLGFFQTDGDSHRDDEDEYDPDMGWSHFT